MEPIDKARELWAQGQRPEEWRDETAPKETLVYRAGHPRQVKDLCSVSHLLGIPVKVAGSHRSKSVELPVGIFRADIWEEEEVFMFTRDNFHDRKIVVVSSCPIDRLPYEVAHDHWTRERYYEEKHRAYEYQRPKPEKNRPGSHDFDEADYESDAWYAKWHGGTLLRHGGEIYRAGSTFSGYYEGIDDLLPDSVFVRYEHGLQNFAIEVDEGVIRQMQIMQRVVCSAQELVQARRDHKQSLGELARYRKHLADGTELTASQLRRFADLVERHETARQP